MSDHQRPNASGAVRPAAWIALLLTGVLIQGCGHGPATSAGPAPRIYAADLTGAARLCEVPKLSPLANAVTEGAVKMVNDGGWCGLPVHQDGPRPFDAGLLTSRPAHGTVLIHQVGDDTRIDYTPDRGFSGTDSFTVKLLPGDATIHETVAVGSTTK